MTDAYCLALLVTVGPLACSPHCSSSFPVPPLAVLGVVVRCRPPWRLLGKSCTPPSGWAGPGEVDGTERHLTHALCNSEVCNKQ